MTRTALPVVLWGVLCAVGCVMDRVVIGLVLWTVGCVVLGALICYGTCARYSSLRLIGISNQKCDLLYDVGQCARLCSDAGRAACCGVDCTLCRPVQGAMLRALVCHIL